MKFLPYRCSACGTEHYIPRALAVACPVCDAQIGRPCRDLRIKKTSPRVTPHPEREALLP